MSEEGSLFYMHAYLHTFTPIHKSIHLSILFMHPTARMHACMHAYTHTYLTAPGMHHAFERMQRASGRLHHCDGLCLEILAILLSSGIHLSFPCPMPTAKCLHRPLVTYLSHTALPLRVVYPSILKARITCPAFPAPTWSRPK